MATSQSGAISVGTTDIKFRYQQSTTSCSDAWGNYYSPYVRWVELMDELEDAAARHRQRAAWFVPRKVRVMAPVPPVRRYQKVFQKHLFPPGRKK